MMKDAVLKFAEQFSFSPEVVNADKLGNFKKFVISGMGGSHLAADLLKVWDESLDVIVHCDYGLPSVVDPDSTLYIFSSYSGNTEEVLDGLEEAMEKGYQVAAIGVGGKLLEAAQGAGAPYVQMPDTGIQPRSALGYSFIGLVKLLGLGNRIGEVTSLAQSLNPDSLSEQGRGLAARLMDRVPVIYSTRRNSPIAYNWKIKLNETGKVPAFFNVFPELNHNEMTGFDVVDSVRHLSDKFSFIFLYDDADNPKNIKRMRVMQKLYDDRGLECVKVNLEGESTLEKVFNSLLLADWMAIYLAEHYGLESEKVPMVEEFKGMI